jgi:ankyrin repeat protein
MNRKDDGQKRPEDDRSKPVTVVPIMGVGLESVLANAINGPKLSANEYFLLLRASPQYAHCDDLTLASHAGDRQRVENLLGNGANVNAGSESGTTALIESLSHGHYEIAQLLFDHGADVDAISKAGWTPLHLAASSGSTNMVSEILTRTAHINLQTQDGWTPLMLAARRRYPNIVRLLLKHGADANLSDNARMTALIHAANGDIDESGGDFECIEALIIGGAFPNAQNNQGWTALMGTAFYGDVESVRLLLANGAEVNARDHQGRTALGLAKEQGHAKLVGALEAACARS